MRASAYLKDSTALSLIIHPVFGPPPPQEDQWEEVTAQPVGLADRLC